MKTYLTALLIAICITTSFAQNTPQEITDTFFKTFKNEGASKAIDELYKSNSWITRNADAISNLKSQLEGLNKDYVGEYYGNEKINSKSLGSSFVHLSYMAKYDRQPLRFIFQYYKPKDTWMIYSFSFDAKISEELAESAKIYYQNL
ncbi:hypothetical protein [Aestuariibaculum suncheonense]|uniref:DUF3887 domain-containing protein n=1 Tax=Aestuariibaculum suncheonense TaxID=1028745 RepID=A0A8J6QEP3_9FLAO|nr:hypothetical protein [Aestuariibaculum suncheonense]MBD0834411.1 hypothetical protein [Aestuariibaculum suncheonense]